MIDQRGAKLLLKLTGWVIGVITTAIVTAIATPWVETVVFSG